MIALYLYLLGAAILWRVVEVFMDVDDTFEGQAAKAILALGWPVVIPLALLYIWLF